MHSPNFFTSHPPSLIQPMQLYFKSVILMGNVVTFLQRECRGHLRAPPEAVNTRLSRSSFTDWTRSYWKVWIRSIYNHVRLSEASFAPRER